MDVSNSVINSFVKELYAELVIQFMRVCVKYLYFLKYVEIAILDQVKQNIVSAWTNEIKHFGNAKTNKDESTHATLKNWLGNSTNNFCRSLGYVNQMI